MADKSEWKTPSMESEGKGDGHQYGRKPRTPKPINSWGTHLVRKRWDIGLLRALSLWIMMMMIVLYCIALYCIVLYCIVLYCIVLYCIVLYLYGASSRSPN